MNINETLQVLARYERLRQFVRGTFLLVLIALGGCANVTIYGGAGSLANPGKTLRDANNNSVAQAWQFGGRACSRDYGRFRGCVTYDHNSHDPTRRDMATYDAASVRVEMDLR